MYETEAWFWDPVSGRVKDTMFIALPHEQLDWHVDDENIQEYVGRQKGHHAYDEIDAATDAWKERVGLSTASKTRTGK